ncbi:MAG: ABC transporter permease [Micrococcales bacterium]|nr:ABC transporter permease [Micrococcales bacterium]
MTGDVATSAAGRPRPSSNLWSLTWLVVGRVRGGRPRLVGTAAGIAIGVTLLLLVVGGSGALADRERRATWAVPHDGLAVEEEPGQVPVLADDEVLVRVGMKGSDSFGGRAVTRVEIAATATSTVEVPGVGRPPAPGQYYASPALADLIASHPADQLGDRYGTAAGTIGDAGLASPDSLVVVVGARPADMVDNKAGNVVRVGELRGDPYPTTGYQVMAIVGGIAVLFPVVVLITVVSRLGQAARAERLAALRLIGATPHRVAVVASIETGAATLVGALLGVVMTCLLVPVAARLSVDDGRFFVADLRVSAATTVGVVVGTVVVGVLVAYVTARRSDIGPLGGSREQHERRPHVVAVVPLLVGITVLLVVTVLSVSGRADTVVRSLLGSQLAFVGGFVVVAVGLVLAGPVLTAWVARLGASRAGGVAGVLAANRVVQHPRATFRSVSGLVLAVFVVSVFAVAATTVADPPVVEAAADERLSGDALTAIVGDDTGLDTQVAALARVDGVRAAVVAASGTEGGWIVPAADASRLGLPVPQSTGLVRVPGDYFDSSTAEGPVVVEPVPDDVATEPIWLVVVATDGTSAALERARTAFVTAGVPSWFPPMTRVEAATSDDRTVASYAKIANLAIVVATGICAVSLAVSTIAGVLDRRRTLGLLRLQGMPVATLRRMLVAEAALPIATVFVGCVGLGFLVAWALVTGLTTGRRTVTWPSGDYYLTLAVSLALAATAVVGTFRTASQRTAMTATRFE